MVTDLMRRRLRFDAGLADRAHTTLLRAIVFGPEPFQGNRETALVSLAGTLVHEHWHTRQNPFGKTWSFWAGMVTRTHPMQRYERPAYERQAAFLEELAIVRPELGRIARAEARKVRGAFMRHYGGE
ncbi:hypothetical protein [Capsulimonas corticalis]|uniref:hypothetical protein n=1 Tax=Capsulimonas corticalis TaxID=2219043 RepID=UPI000F64647F|nr:hypothetical protein [Capsulimonas corticalis]